ncbi:MAG TPA: hypothetical protein VMZ52_20970, partial [Bryobacteraceae bacterium]|nr:hypothetical protein [Bryobacteraceae bacterium]
GIPLLGAILVFCVAALLWGEEQYRAMVFIFAAAMAQLVAAHYAVGLLYPYGRTGLYLVPIFSLMWLLAVRDTGQWPRIQFLAAVPFCVCIALFVGQTNRTAYAEWLFCASTKTVAKILRQNGAVRVGVSWPLEPSLNYYRQRYRITGMQPITRESPDGNYDHFVLLPEDYSLVAKRQLKVVFQDDESKVLVAVPR